MLALLGGYAGASLARRTEYEKWLRQEKSKAFAELLTQLHETRISAIEIMGNTALPEAERSISANHMYAKLRKHEAVARLYMSTTGRDRMEKYMSSIWLLATSSEGLGSKIIEVRQHMDGLQHLLEAELHSGPSVFRARPKA